MLEESLSTLEVTAQGDPPHVYARVTGDLDLVTAPRLHQELTRLLATGCRRLDLDLAGVTFVAAAGLAVIAEADRRFRDASGLLSIVGPTPMCLRLLTLTGLDETLTIR